MVKVAERRICWPEPDATCLHGGCIHCNGYPFKALSTIRRYALKAGVLPHRGQGEQSAIDAFEYGYRNGFFNADTRTRERR